MDYHFPGIPQMGIFPAFAQPARPDLASSAGLAPVAAGRSNRPGVADPDAATLIQVLTQWKGQP
jgi:hypothetical protein